MRDLRSIALYTDLVSDLPRPFFEGLVDYLAHAMGVHVSLVVAEGDDPGLDPFSAGRADIGLLRSPSLLRWWGCEQAPLVLLPVAPVFRDPRAQGKPVYFAEVVVRGSHPAQSFWDLRGCIWGYSRPGSLTSHVSVIKKLAELEEDERFFRSQRCSGSHRQSLRLLREGEVDAVAVDSNVLILARRRNPELRHELRVLESWGPLPIQPVVAREDLPLEVRQDVVRHFCRMGSLPVGRELLDDVWMSGFVPCDEEPYQQMRRSLRDLGLAPATSDWMAGERAGVGGEERFSTRLRYFLHSLF